MIRAVIFDCFGVLVEDALSVLCQQLAPTERQQATDIMHAAHRGLVTPEDSNKQIAALLGMSREAYRAAIRDGEIKNDELLEYILALRGQYKTAMLSNISTGGITRRFTPQELALFDTVVASGDIGYAKPEPEAYEITADRLGVRLDECVFTDDHEEFCEGARGVGMQAILYTNFTQFKADLEKLLASEKGKEQPD
jgi:putative hydrolase of the HAD superfamily